VTRLVLVEDGRRLNATLRSVLLSLSREFLLLCCAELTRSPVGPNSIHVVAGDYGLKTVAD
jgi:succinate-acetate transporter protein